MSGDDNMVEKGSDISAQIETNTTGVSEQVLPEWGGVDGTALVESYKNDIVAFTRGLANENQRIAEQDGVELSKERKGEISKRAFLTTLSIASVALLLEQAACAPKPVNADTQPTPDATQTLAAQVEESQVISDTPENIEEIPDEDMYTTIPDTQAIPSTFPEVPTQEVVEEHPEVDFSFKYSDVIGGENKYEFPEGDNYYYGITIAGMRASAIGRYQDRFGAESFAQDFYVGFSGIMEHVHDLKLLNKYMNYRNKESEINKDGYFIHEIVVFEETNEKGEKSNRFFDPKGAIQLTMNGETRPISDDEIPWDDLPKEAWELIKEGYKDITIGENGEISADCFFTDYVHKADNPTAGGE